MAKTIAPSLRFVPKKIGVFVIYYFRGFFFFLGGGGVRKFMFRIQSTKLFLGFSEQKNNPVFGWLVLKPKKNVVENLNPSPFFFSAF